MRIDYEGFFSRVQESLDNLPVQAIANKFGLTKQAVYSWQKGVIPKPEILVGIAELNSISLHWLLTGEGPKTLLPENKQPVRLLPFKTKEPKASADQVAFNRTVAELTGIFYEDDQWQKARLWFSQMMNERFGFTEKERLIIEEIADAGGIDFIDTVVHLVREALAAKGVGEMPETMPVMVFQTIDDEVFRLIDRLPEEKRQDEVHRLIGKLVAKAAAK